MRPRDQHKREAIFEATVKLVSDVGFADVSVSKIAKEANVSPATIYVYYKNKEDLLISIFVEIHEQKASAAMKGFDETSPLKEMFRKIWNNSFKFISENRDHLQYHEQFRSSPYNDLVNSTEATNIMQPFLAALESGAKDKVIKRIDDDILVAFIFSAIPVLSSSSYKTKMTRKNIETAFEMAWDAIKL
ncbi:MAG: TetR/AcrR family transcriptional regulator [Gammaproteobacteria bacterium]|nr:TetR/AcrR family transcriptional regulator [Gammaproteobacteria bacterium]